MYRYKTSLRSIDVRRPFLECTRRFAQSACIIREYRKLSHSLTRGDADFDLSGFFEPYVQQWLIDTDNKTKQWVQAVSE
jgi:hypothetical protein